MGQCVGRSKRSGERCKRTVPAGASTCYYHRPAAGQVKRVAARRVRSQGILVYDDETPVGWCQFVPKDKLRFADAAASGAAWFVTCFVIDPRYRGLGATGVALRAAVKAIGRRGGGIVEGHATAIAPGPTPKPERKGAYREGDVLFSRGSAKVRFEVEVEGVGAVTALYRSKRSMHGAPLGGTVDLFRREGFEAVAVLPRPTSRRAAFMPYRIVVQRTV